jgi:hypothetical protein
MEDFMIGLIMGIIFTATFSLTNKDYITQEEYEYAEQLCVDNKTLKKVGSAGTRYTAVCVNGAEFYYAASDMRKNK